MFGNREAADTAARRRSRRARYVAAGAISIAVHGALAAFLVSTRITPVATPEVPAAPVEVTLFRPLPPPPPPPPVAEASADPGSAPASEPTPAAAEPAAAPQPTPARPATRVRAPRTPPPPTVEPLPAAIAARPAVFPTLGEAQAAGALVVGAGPGGGGGGGGTGSGSGGAGSGSGGPCDMLARIQQAVRSDPEVRAAIFQAHQAEGSGRALLVWNGDWIQNPGQAGKGLAGVRQAIGLEVAFAPAACRSQAVHGFAVVSLADSPGAPRLALGTAAWRWSDLTGASR